MVKTGLSADLILLNENPLEDISNMEKIEGVMVRGLWHPKKAIERDLSVIEAYNKE